MHARRYNDNGQCGSASTGRVSAFAPVAALSGTAGTSAKAKQAHSYNGAEHTLIVLEDGSLVAFGYNYRCLPPTIILKWE